MAERSNLCTSGATPFLVNANVLSACSTRRPLIRFSTRRAFCGETRMYMAFAVNSMTSSFSYFAGFAVVSAAAFTECPLNCRVKLNSPNLWPTMFSVTYTGMNFFPLCTATVWPTISGTIVERRDQVRITFFSFRVFMPSTFVMRWASINGPFFVERAIYTCLFRPAVHDERIGPLIVTRLVSTSRLSPRSYRVTSARGLSFAATMWMVDGVHHYTAIHRAASQPAGASSLADGDVLVI